MSRLVAIARAAAPLASTPRRLAAAWAALTLVVLASLAAAPGISRDEASVLAPIVAKSRTPAATPPLAPELAAATHTVLSRTGLSHLRAARLGTALAGAILSVLLCLLGWDLAGKAGALLAPALFWLAPRHLQAGLSAAPDLALASLWLALAAAYRRAISASSPKPVQSALLVGLLFGAALTVRPDTWVLLPLLALHAAASALVRLRSGPGERKPAAAWALASMLAAVPAALLVGWGVPWRTPLHEVAAAFAPVAGIRSPGPLALTALALPATLLLTGAAGLAHSVARLVRALRGRLESSVASEELLFLLLAAAPFACAAWGIAPHSGGVRSWLHAMPFVTLLATRSLVTAAGAAWPSGAVRLTGALSLLVLYPALRSTVHAFPAGGSTWNEIAGGAPGAASLGMPRQNGGEAVAALLPEIAARARSGARVWWVGAPPAAVRLYALDGRLRSDLVAAESLEDADLAIVTLDGASRDAEYQVWSAFRTARPAAGTYLDEVPLAFVYARPGAWR